MQDCYEILNVNKDYIIQQNMDEAKTNAYIKECYNKTIRKEVEIPREIAISNDDTEELKLLEQVREICDAAYEIIGSAEGRANYAETENLNEKAYLSRIKNAAIQEKFKQLKKQYNKTGEEVETQKEMQLDKYTKFREKYQQRTKRTPYNILNIQKENFEKLFFSEKMKLLKDKKEILLKNASSLLGKSHDFISRAEINIRMNEIAEAYDSLKLQVYENRYVHTQEYDPHLIKGMVEHNDSIENKVVIRQNDKKPIKMQLSGDKERRNIRVKTTAKIGYKNSENEEGWLYEYQVTRKIDGKDKSDIVRSPVSIVDILLDKRIGKDYSMDYYNCLVNELLAEDTIKGAAPNGGFLGSIEKDKEGKYHITLSKDKLDRREKEMLTATMICREKERKKSEEERE